ncbi:hypothetical protein ACWDSD_41105 [Streptomyces spiralis]
MSPLVLTDRNVVTGAVRFAQAVLDHGVRPVLGINLTVAPLTPAAVQYRRNPGPHPARTCRSRPSALSCSPSPAGVGPGCTD